MISQVSGELAEGMKVTPIADINDEQSASTEEKTENEDSTSEETEKTENDGSVTDESQSENQ